MKRVFGVDLGGTTIKFSVIDEAGNFIDRWAIPTNTENGGANIPGDIIESLKSKMATLFERGETVEAIGVGTPGPVSGDVVECAVNLGWTNMPLGHLLQEGTGLPVTLLNDANAAALGEAWMGGDSAFRASTVVFVTLGTGVGGGVIVDGKVLNGQHGCAGEVGHMPVMAADTRQCGCGKTNCLECYCSATGFVKTANDLYEAAGDTRVYTEGKDVFDQVAAGDEIAIQARDITVDYLARGLAAIMSTVDPQEVIVGGGLSHAGELLMGPLAEKLDEYVFPGTRGKYVLRRATLGNDAGALGAAYQAFQMLAEGAGEQMI